MRSFFRLILYFTWHFIVSLEFLLSVVLVAVYSASPVVRQICREGVCDNEKLRWCALLPLGISAWLFAELRKILWPNTDKKKLFLKWPGYKRLKTVCAVAFFYAALCCVLAVLSVLFPGIFADGLRSFIIIFSTAVVFVDAVSCWLASLTAEQILSSVADD